MKAIHENQNPVQHISEQIQADRCGCEVNNPQGSCCLGNVMAFVHSIRHEIEQEIENDPELKASIDRAKQDIKAGRVYSTEEAIKMLEHGEFER
nr:hypothetical protein [Alicyclobacillus sp. ALC3]